MAGSPPAPVSSVQPALIEYGEDYLARQVEEMEALRAAGKYPCAYRDISPDCSAMMRTVLDTGNMRAQIREVR